MKIISLFLFLVFAIACVEPEEKLSRTEKALLADCEPATFGYRNYGDKHTFTASDGKSYDYYVNVPLTYSDCEGEYPLVLNFHGGGQNAKNFSTKKFMAAFREESKSVGAVLVWIDSGHWSGTWKDGVFPDPPRDHALMVDEFVDYVQGLLSIDEDRIHALGFSNGAMFTQHLAATQSDTFASVVSIAGRSGSSFHRFSYAAWMDCLDGIGPCDYLALQTIWPAWPVWPPASATNIDIMMVRGDLDPKVPIDGGGNIFRSSGLPAITNPVDPGWSDYELWQDTTGCTSLTVLVINFTTQYKCTGGSGDVRHDLVTDMNHALPMTPNYDGAKESADFLWSHPK